MELNNDIRNLIRGLEHYIVDIMRKRSVPENIRNYIRRLILEWSYNDYKSIEKSYQKSGTKWDYSLNAVSLENIILDIKKTNINDGRVISMYRYETTCVDNQFIVKDYLYLDGDKAENLDSIFTYINGVETIREFTCQPCENVFPYPLMDVSLIKKLDFFDLNSVVLQNAIQKKQNYKYELVEGNQLSYGFFNNNGLFDVYVSFIVNNSNLFVDIIGNHATIHGFSYVDQKGLDIESFIDNNKSSDEIIMLFNIIKKLQDCGIAFNFENNNTDTTVAILKK